MAFVITLELALNLDVEWFFSDSQLVIGLIVGTSERKDESTSLYFLEVHDLQRWFKSCEIFKIARAQNNKVDALSCLVIIGLDGFDKAQYKSETRRYRRWLEAIIDKPFTGLHKITIYKKILQLQRVLCFGHQVTAW